MLSLNGLALNEASFPVTLVSSQINATVEVAAEAQRITKMIPFISLPVEASLSAEAFGLIEAEPFVFPVTSHFFATTNEVGRATAFIEADCAVGEVNTLHSAAATMGITSALIAQGDVSGEGEAHLVTGTAAFFAEAAIIRDGIRYFDASAHLPVSITSFFGAITYTPIILDAITTTSAVYAEKITPANTLLSTTVALSCQPEAILPVRAFADAHIEVEVNAAAINSAKGGSELLASTTIDVDARVDADAEGVLPISAVLFVDGVSYKQAAVELDVVAEATASPEITVFGAADLPINVEILAYNRINDLTPAAPERTFVVYGEDYQFEVLGYGNKFEVR